MSEDESSLLESYDHFIQRVAKTGIIWGLHSEADGWANSPSDDFEETDVILFWSDRALAEKLRTEEWAGHVAQQIEFDDFIDAWLQGMDADGVMAGPDWTADLAGIEVTAKDLADRLLMERDPN